MQALWNAVRRHMAQIRERLALVLIRERLALVL